MPEADLRHFTENILLESQRLDGFIQRMLEVARVENLSHLEKTQRINLNSLVASVVAYKKIDVDRKGIILLLSCEGEANVLGDEFMLQQVVDNLIVNAIEFSPKQGRVTVACRVQKNNVTIEVVDEGEGIPDYALERIFERFYSLPRPLSGKRSSGLGLTFSKRVIELHGGSITLENLASRGACASITLPKA